MKYTIDTEEEFRTFINNNKRTVVVFGKEDCLHCAIVENFLEDMKHNYPLVSFGYTLNTDMAHSRGFHEYPYVYFYEDGQEMGRLRGSGNVHKLKDILNIWIRKD